MERIDIVELIDYWLLTAEHDYKTMLALFKSKRYSDSLFFGHIVLEKVLKGLVVKKIRKPAPYIHDLIRLAEIGDVKLSKREENLLNEVNEFNIRARYPEDRLGFYRTCTREYTKKYLDKIDNLYKKLCQKLKAGKKRRK
jgi:HEPN domain-containing protein